MAVYGVSAKDGISGYLKAQITQGDISVIGYIGEGAVKSLTSNWTAPFESDTLGQSTRLQTAAAIGQQVTGGMTLINQFNSTMIWQGTTPPSIALPLYFQAYSDAKREVQDAIAYLEYMASPDLSAKLAPGQAPQPVVIDVGRRFKVTNVVIQEVSSELDAPRTRQGYMTRNTVTLTLSPKQMVNKSDILSHYL